MILRRPYKTPFPSQASRDVFPRHDDRVVIQTFLAGRAYDPRHHTTAMLTTTGKTLALGDTTTVAWYDTAGALCAILVDNVNRAYSILVINQIMVTLGQPDTQLTRDVNDYGSNPSIPMRYFFDGSPVTPGAPFVLCGALGVLAYRTSAT